jgi:hypothetical protein
MNKSPMPLLNACRRAVFLLVLCVNQAVAADVLVDEFDHPSLDLEKWTANTDIRGSSVAQNSGYAQLVNGGTLITKAEFGFPVTIRARFQLSAVERSNLKFVLRSNGEGIGSERKGVAVQLSCRGDWDGYVNQLAIFEIGSSTPARVMLTTPLNLNQWYSVMIVDRGSAIDLYFDGATTPSLTLASSFSPGRKVAIYNREGGAAGSWISEGGTARIDSIVISTGDTDSDSDGANDHRETADGTDPNDPNSFNPLSVGLVAYYPFDGNANDESGFGDSGSVAGSAALTWNRFGHAESAYLFDGESQYITTTGSYLPRNAEPRSVSLWVRADDLPTQPTISIPLAWGANADNQAFGIIMGPEVPAKWGVQFWGGGQDTMSDVNVEQKWHHLAAVYDGNNVELYVDGVNRLTSNKSTSTGAGGLSIGADDEGISGFKGAVDDVRIYNRALSTSDVRNLYYEEAFPTAQRTFIASNPDRFGLFSGSDYVANRESGQTDVTTDPASFNLFTQSQFDSNRSNGQTDVTTSPAAFNLFTQNEYESFGILRFRNGRDAVTANPAAFDLFTQNQVSESYTQGQNSVLQSIPSVDFSVPESTTLRVTLGGQNVIGIVVDDTEAPLPDNWRLDEQAGQLVGSVVGSNSVSVVLEGEMAGGAPAIRIPMNFYPQAGQTIAPFARIPTQAFRFAPLTITPPAASSGFAVVLSVKSGPATIVDNQVTFTGIGKVVLAANQVGNKDMKAAPEVTTSFLVTKGRQNMNFPPLNSIPFVQGSTFQLSATTSSALPIAYASSKPRVISISGSTATIVGRGVATIRATQSGDSNWSPATPINRAIRIY